MFGSLSDEALFALGCLCDRPMRVNELSERLVLTPGMRWADLDEQRVYRELHFLRQRGLVEWSRTGPGSRRTYSISEKGREALSNYLLWDEAVRRVNQYGFDLVVNALVALEPAMRRKVIRQRRSYILNLQDALNVSLAKLGHSTGAHQAILQHHTLSLKMELTWLNEIEMSIDDWDAQ